MHEITLDMSDKSIAALTNGNIDKPLLLALHGWLDNAASFLPMSEFLDDYNFIAIDLIGHGKSSHRDTQAHYNLVDYVQDLYQLIEQQQWQDIYLLGHSLGGIISTMFAAAFPEHVRKLICIETAGPLTEPEDTTTKQLRESIISRHVSLTSVIKQPVSVNHIVQSRCKVSDLAPKHAELVLRRNIIEDDKGVVTWRTDKRLRTKSSLRLSEVQTRDLISHIKCPCHIILGSQGFAKVKTNLNNRRTWFTQLTTDIASGGHHVHMESCEQVVTSIRMFLEQK